MKISALRILELNKEHKLLENLSKRELENSEGAGIDIRVGQVYRAIGDSFLGADETGGKRHSPEIEMLGDLEKDGYKKFTLRPKTSVLVKTVETIYSPDYKIKYDDFFPEAYLKPVVYPRTSLQRGVVALLATKTDPGYRGPLTFALCNLGEEDFTFELGARMFNIEYEPVIGDINRPYKGQHQGGRMTSQGKEETQI